LRSQAPLRSVCGAASRLYRAGAPSNTETKCLTAVQIPGAALLSYDISWVNPHRAEYYLADRSNAAIDIINTDRLTFKRFLGRACSSASSATPAAR
jgi:hypothetical protein